MPQGGLEVPYTLIFEGSSSDVTKATKLIKHIEESEGHSEADKTAEDTEVGHFIDDKKVGKKVWVIF